MFREWAFEVMYTADSDLCEQDFRNKTTLLGKECVGTKPNWETGHTFVLITRF